MSASRIPAGIACGATLLLVLLAAPVDAQTADTAGQTLSDVVRFLVTNQSVQTGDFVKDRAAAEAASAAIGRAMLVSLSTLPTTASSAGFTYRWNPALGTLERTSESFGPTFVERAATSGRGRAAVGATWDYASFDELDGTSLGDGTLVTTANRFTDESAPFDVESLTMNIRSSVFTMFGSVGVTDRLDVGAAVPLVRLDIDGRRDDVYRGTRAVQAQATASTSGFGDIALRAKYTVLQVRGSGLAVGGEVRLPTGREEDLLGAGKMGTRLLIIGSAEGSYVGVHGNVGFGWGGISDQVTYATALVLSASTRVTFSAELTGQRLTDVSPLIDVAAAHPDIPDVETLRLESGLPGVNVAQTGISMKWNPGSTYLVKASVLVPATHAGLTARARFTLGLDYAF